MSPAWLTLDAAAVSLFVLIGRASHHEGAAGFLHTAAPFLIGVVLGWLVMRAWREPEGITVGLGVTATTLLWGIVLRNVLFGDGIALSFVLVATAFLTLFLMGWRVAVKVATRVAR